MGTILGWWLFDYFPEAITGYANLSTHRADFAEHDRPALYSSSPQKKKPRETPAFG